jgi:GAF domain-containing protein
VELPAATPLPARADPVFDWFARKIGHLLDAPMALVSLVHVGGQVLPGAFGTPQPWEAEREMPLAYSFCQYVVRTGRPFIVPNAHDHPVVATNDAVTDLGVIAYAGVPLTIDNEPRGAVCGIDHIPRPRADRRPVRSRASQPRPAALTH